MEKPGDKKALRASLMRRRAAIPADERRRVDALIAARVLASPAYRGADAVLTYLGVGSEVETRNVIRSAWASGKTVALPRCIPGTRRLAWHRIGSLDGLERSRFGVEEPPDDPATLVDPDAFDAPLALVPGLSFDPRGFRIGYGGGFYDVFLAGFGGATIGLCRECQLSGDGIAFLDGHDRPVQAVATERRMLHAR